MNPIRFYVLDAFTDTAFQGNPAGVFFDDEAVLTPEEMQRMANEISLESAFVTPGDIERNTDYCLRYFTGATEVPFCGHDTVAAATALVHAGRVDPRVKQAIRFQTRVGTIEVLLRQGQVTLVQNLPEFGPIHGAAMTHRIAKALGCSVHAIVETGLPVQTVSTGTPWILAPVNSREVVDAAPADFAAITEISRETGTFGIYVFAIDEIKSGIVDGASVWSRCFAPIAGLNEDPVTGSASGALGGYLVQHGCLERVRLGDIYGIWATQGMAGGRGGSAVIWVGRGEDGAVNRITVTGTAVLVAEGSFRHG